MPADYSSAARALSLSPTPASPAADRPFTRPRAASRLSTARPRGRPKSASARLYDSLVATGETLIRGYLVLSPRQRVLFIIATVISTIFSILFLVYSPRIFTALGPVAHTWRETPGGWVPIWLAIFASAFPPADRLQHHQHRGGLRLRLPERVAPRCHRQHRRVVGELRGEQDGAERLRRPPCRQGPAVLGSGAGSEEGGARDADHDPVLPAAVLAVERVPSYDPEHRARGLCGFHRLC